MELWMWIAIGVAAAVVILALALIPVMRSGRKRRTTHLRETFGPEYQRTVQQVGRSKAEKDLVDREKQAQELELRTLSPEDARRYSDEWTAVQAHFVDSPSESIARADRLVIEVMQARGYPVFDFEQRAGVASVHHPRVVMEYREAHDIALRNQRHQASTEDLRQAMVHYRAMFHELLEVGYAPAPVAVS